MNQIKRKRKFRTRAEKKKYLQEWREMEAAGIDRGEYCKSIDVPISTFSYWLKSVPRRKKRPAKPIATPPPISQKIGQHDQDVVSIVIKNDSTTVKFAGSSFVFASRDVQIRYE